MAIPWLRFLLVLAAFGLLSAAGSPAPARQFAPPPPPLETTGDTQDESYDETYEDTPFSPPEPEPPASPPEPAEWVVDSPWTWEVGFVPAVGLDVRHMGAEEEREIRFLYGGTMRAGFLYQRSAKQPRCTGDFIGCLGKGLAGALKSIAIGNQYGADLRLHAWRQQDATWFGVGIEPLILFVWGDRGEGTFARIRTMTLVGSLLPEVSFLAEPGGDQAVLLRFVIPISILVTRNFGLEFRLSEALMWPRERPFSFNVAFGIGFLFR